MTRAVFLGTPPAAVPSLAALSEVADIAAVITQPDRPKGRSSALVTPAVKEAALDWGLRVAQPESRSQLEDALASVGEFDVGVVVAYGRIIPEDALATAYRGFLNVHFSLLPRWRGASPVVRTILAGDDETGVSLMELDAGLDTGPIVAAEATAVRHDDTTGSLTARLSHRGASLLARHLVPYAEGAMRPKPQDDARATAAGLVRTEEAHVAPTHHSAVAVERAVRAFDPRPGAWTNLAGDRVKLWKVSQWSGGGPQAGVVELVGDAVVMGCRQGAIQLLEVQPAGKSRLAAADWFRGRTGPVAYSSS